MTASVTLHIMLTSLWEVTTTSNRLTNGAPPRYVLLRCPKSFARFSLAGFRPLPLLFARFFRHRRRSQTSPLRVPSIYVNSLMGGNDDKQSSYQRGSAPLCPVAVPEILRSQDFDRCHSFLLASSATGGARKHPRFGFPPCCIYAYAIIHDAPGKCKSGAPLFLLPHRRLSAARPPPAALTGGRGWIIVQTEKRRGEGRAWTNTS